MLLLELFNIDQVIKKNDFKFYQGYLFTKEFKNKIIADLHSCLNKKHFVIESGFKIWQIR
jgi:hypothetical protein